MKRKVIRITTIPMSLNILFPGQLKMLSEEYEVVAVSSPGKELDEVGRREGVRTVAVPMERHISPFKDLVSLYRLVRLFRKEKPWMVHSHTPKAGLLAMLAAWMCGVPVRIHTFTGLVFPTAVGMKQRLLMATDRLTCACATLVNPEGKGVKRDLERYHITSKPLRIIGNGNVNGIDLSYFSRTQEVCKTAATVREEGCVTFCFVGRLVGDKGMNELVRAFLRLYAQHTQVRLLLVGPFEDELDPLQPDTKQILLNHPAIRFMGWQSDIRPFLAASDIFVFPSYREGFPNVVLQAGAMGLPCIVTDINGCNEIVQEGVNGLIIPPRDENSLYEAMYRLATHPEERESMALQARPMIANRYEQHDLWNKLKEIYQAQIKK